MNNFDNGLFGIDVTKRADKIQTPKTPVVQDKVPQNTKSLARESSKQPQPVRDERQEVYVENYDGKISEPER